MDTQPRPDLPLFARLLYGTGLRLLEGLRLRTKDLDLARRALVVREGKGGKDRVVMLPPALEGPLRAQLSRAHTLWAADHAAGVPGVHMPHALVRNCPRAAESWAGVFPQPALSVDPRTGLRRRHHLPDSLLQRAFQQAVATVGVRQPATPHTLRLRHAPAAGRLRHPHRAGTAGPRRRQHHHELHACAAHGRWRGAQPA